jgi:hypothetical protein
MQIILLLLTTPRPLYGSLSTIPRELYSESDSQLGELLHVVERELGVIGGIARRMNELVRVRKGRFCKRMAIRGRARDEHVHSIDVPIVKADWYPA